MRLKMASSSNSNLINFNGVLQPAGHPLLTADNRGFRYGDGLFETMFVHNGQIRLMDHHFQRLLTGMKMLYFDAPPGFSALLQKQIPDLCIANAIEGPARVRLTLFRGDSSLFGPIDRSFQYIIQCWPIDTTETDGLNIGIFPNGRKSCDPLSNLKSNNYLVYTLAIHYAKEQRLDDCLVLNTADRVADSTISNLFYIKQREFYTPPLSEGGVAGVMRRFLLEALSQAGYKVHEQQTSIDDLLSADELFLTNALKGIRTVRCLQHRNYEDNWGRTVYEELLKML